MGYVTKSYKFKFQILKTSIATDPDHYIYYSTIVSLAEPPLFLLYTTLKIVSKPSLQVHVNYNKKATQRKQPVTPQNSARNIQADFSCIQNGLKHKKSMRSLRRMILLLPPSFLLPISKLSLFLSLTVCRLSSLLMGKERGWGGGGKEPYHPTARKPGPL
jgi:hypothetical protein